MNTSDLIQPTHLQRRAVIYVRQSSPNQVINNQESTRLQYALKKRAIERGWHERDTLVIDTDLGRTGSTAVDRPRFQEMVTLVTLGQVGIVYDYDATRLARNCTDWYQLLDLCGFRQCLVGDQDGIYDPSTPNGRLILGLKGLIAELELHTIRARLQAGTISKAERGELAIPLPTGLLRLETGQVVKDPDVEIQDRISLIFQILLEEKGVSKVVRHLRDQRLKIPRRDKWGALEVSDGIRGQRNGAQPCLRWSLRLWPHTLGEIEEDGAKTTGLAAARSVACVSAGQVPGLHFLGRIREN